MGEGIKHVTDTLYSINVIDYFVNIRDATCTQGFKDLALSS